MKKIEELFKLTYGFPPKDEEDVFLFIKLLYETLTYREKIYIYNQYGVDLISAEETEIQIIRKMRHPVRKRQFVK